MAIYYQFDAKPTVNSHFKTAIRLARDSADDFGSDADMSELLIRARVHSNDYIVTLLTELEKVAASLHASDTPEAAAIDKIVAELTYIDKYFRLEKIPTPQA